MAKFNTLAGGYYGKLGVTVGQRWKNLRTVRAYVIPRNPQTEVQQANRRRFSDCVFYAQVAGQMNAKVTAFDTVSKTLWNARMSTARALQDLGLEQMDRFPLYPSNFTVPFFISAASITQIIDETHVQVTVEGIAPEEERVLTMLLLLPGSGDWKDRLALCIGSNGDTGGNIFTFRLPENLTLGDGLQARFVSCDDTDSSVDLIASSQINLPINAVEHHTFDTTITNVERSGNNFTFTFGEDYQSGDNSITVASLKGVVNGAITTVSNPSVSLINNGGKFAMVYTSEATDNQDLIAFPTGSQVVISEVKSWSSSVHADAENVTESFSSTDLTRTYKNTFSGYQRNTSSYRLRFSRSLPTISSKSGTVTAYAVVNGAFQNIIMTGYTLATDYLQWDSGVSDSQLLPAFPSGSTVTMGTVIVGNGVTYNPERTSAQAVVGSSDLEREITVAPTKKKTSSEIYFEFLISGTFTTKQTQVSGQWWDNRDFLLKNSGNPIVATFTGSKLKIGHQSTNQNPPAFTGSYWQTTEAVSGVAEGVTYTLKARKENFTNVGVSFFELSALAFDSMNVTESAMSLSFADGNTICDKITSESWTISQGGDLAITAQEGYKGTLKNADDTEMYYMTSINPHFYGVDFEDAAFVNGSPSFPSDYTETSGTANAPNDFIIITAPDGSKFQSNAQTISNVQMDIDLS